MVAGELAGERAALAIMRAILRGREQPTRLTGEKMRRNKTHFLVNIILLIGRDVKRNLGPFQRFLLKIGLVLIRVVGDS
jgi:hypothetical protein